MAPVMIVVLAAVGGLVMLLWNWLMPALFPGLRTVDYWQALGLLLLCRILFGGHVRGRARQHWDDMTAEERERLKRHFRNHWTGQYGVGGAEDTAWRSSRRASADSPARDACDREDRT
jgi:hypothetical protein